MSTLEFYFYESPTKTLGDNLELAQKDPLAKG